MKLDKEFLKLQWYIEKISRMREKTIAKNHKKVLDELRKILSRLYEQYEIDGQLTFEEMAKYNRLQKLDKEVEKMINELYKDNTKLIRGHLRGVAGEVHINTIELLETASKRRLRGIVKELDVIGGEIHTLEGIHEVIENDWIIKGVKGELYPCKPDIFEMTYEKLGASIEPKPPESIHLKEGEVL